MKLKVQYYSPAPSVSTTVLLSTGDVTKITKARVAVYTCPFDAMNTETKGTVLLKSAKELLEFSKGEEDLIEQVIQQAR